LPPPTPDERYMMLSARDRDVEDPHLLPESVRPARGEDGWEARRLCRQIGTTEVEVEALAGEHIFRIETRVEERRLHLRDEDDREFEPLGGVDRQEADVIGAGRRNLPCAPGWTR
jgi:hypothetical protein